MGVLTVRDIRKAIVGLPQNTVVIIGNDDELNGVHNAWYIQTEEVNDVKLKAIGSVKMFEGTVTEDEFGVHLGHVSEKTNIKKVLLIT